MNPILKYIRNLSAFQRVIGDSTELTEIAKADVLLSDLVDKKKVPGIAISVFKEGKTILQKGYGYADLESKTPINPEKTIFRIASVSKNIAATALAYLVEEGKINLDASFYDYVPYFPKKEYDFTIRQLASHTAGIRSYRGIEYGLNIPYSIKEGIDLFKNDPLVFKPGTQYLYTSFDWVLLSLAMQELTGKPFENLVQELVLNPLGLTSTFAATNNSKKDLNQIVAENLNQDEFATFYSKNKLGFRKAITVDNYYKLAGGGYLSTVTDISKFGQSILNGEVFNETTKATFLTSEEINGVKTYYGLGWQVSEDASGRTFYGHVGNGVGGYSNFFVYPNEQLVFALLTNCTDPKIQEYLDQVVSLLLD
ncbi:beta-lactamase family protein [Aurantibacter crassamenti]|uniref:serine hydrolase domain-containing protein n=1 Tax=Aurantibacter crassamenti TaxID=1837375 RepID=UPI00193A6C12|nr:serine hydrolase domain-containing protein [Aurantibacter crassamenti]MBM1108139.1 beta-lactamase family protein [Aurantibacter crassamenti]